MGRRATLAAFLGAVVSAGWLLVVLGAHLGIGGRLDADSWDPLRGGPALVVLVVWTLAAVLVGWLALATIAQLVATLSGVIQPWADRISPRSLQRLGRGLAGLSLTAGLAAPAPSAGIPVQAPPTTVVAGAPALTTTSAPVPGGTASLRPIDAADPPVAPSSRTAEPGGGTATMRLVVGPELPVASPAVPIPIVPPTTIPVVPPTTIPVVAPITIPPTTIPSTTDPPAPPPADQPSAPSGAAGDLAAGDGGGTVVVQPGDSFWSIAESELVRTGLPSDEQAVARYWRRLIEANRHRVVDPDLIHPGQVLALPTA